MVWIVRFGTSQTSFVPLLLVTSFLFTDLLLLLLQTKVKGLEKNFCVVAVIHMSKDAKQCGLWITGGMALWVELGSLRWQDCLAGGSPGCMWTIYIRVTWAAIKNTDFEVLQQLYSPISLWEPTFLTSVQGDLSSTEHKEKCTWVTWSLITILRLSYSYSKLLAKLGSRNFY